MLPIDENSFPVLFSVNHPPYKCKLTVSRTTGQRLGEDYDGSYSLGEGVFTVVHRNKILVQQNTRVGKIHIITETSVYIYSLEIGYGKLLNV